MSRSFDAIIIGAGQAGPSLAGRLTATGMKVALIERKLMAGPASTRVACPPKRWSPVPMPHIWRGAQPNTASWSATGSRST